MNVEAEALSGGGLGKFENSVTRAGSAGWSRVGTMSEMPEQNVSGSFKQYKTLDSPPSEVGNHGGFCTQNDLICAVFEEDYSDCCL